MKVVSIGTIFVDCCAFQFLIVIFCKLEILAMGLWSSERRNECKRASSPALYHHHHEMFPALGHSWPL